jgi:hypothetical protein
MKKVIISTCCIIVSLPVLQIRGAVASTESKIELSFDVSSALALIDVFERGEITQDQLENLVNLHGIQSIISKVSSYDDRASLEGFKMSLQNILAGELLDQDPFQFQQVKDRLPEMRRLIQLIKDNPNKLVSEITDMIQPYSPGDLAFRVKVYLVIGGSSDGWAKDGNFYLALHYFRDDYEGMKLMMAHELYHIAQRHFFGDAKDSDNPFITACQSLLRRTRSEGTASMVGDPLEIASGKSYAKWYRQKFNRNLKRITQNFALFETMLFRLYNDQDIKFNQLYPLGFSGGWDSPLYFVGYYIGRTIEKYQGREVLVNILKDTPTAFFNTYIDIYKKHPDKDLVMFSSSVENILHSILK